MASLYPMQRPINDSCMPRDQILHMGRMSYRYAASLEDRGPEVIPPHADCRREGPSTESMPSAAAAGPSSGGTRGRAWARDRLTLRSREHDNQGRHGDSTMRPFFPRCRAGDAAEGLGGWPPLSPPFPSGPNGSNAA